MLRLCLRLFTCVFLLILLAGTQFACKNVEPKERKLKIGKIERVGNMLHPRARHQAVLLKDGRTLIIGGSGPYLEPKGGHICCEILQQAELFNPLTKQFTYAGNFITPRYQFSAALMNNGMVLVSGGLVDNQSTVTTEFYDPTLNKFVSGPNLIIARHEHVITPLLDGRALITGGFQNNKKTYHNYVNTIEIYDPITNKFRYVGKSSFPYAKHSTLVLKNGKVLIAGSVNPTTNRNNGTIEIYDPKTGKIQSGGKMSLHAGRPRMILLDNGLVLLAESENGNKLAFELYNPEIKSFNKISGVRLWPNMIGLSNTNKVIIFGYRTLDDNDYSRISLYDPMKGEILDIGHMLGKRNEPSLIKLSDKQILLTGGNYGDTYPTFSEIYSY